MPIELRKAYLIEIRLRYSKSTKKKKGLILDEFCEVSKLTRKHAIKILNGKLNPRTKRPGPKSRYQKDNVIIALKELWELMNKMCSKKMKFAFIDWLPFYNATDEVKVLLLSMSPSTIDRLLKPHRSPLKKGLSGTKANLIKNRIPLKLIDGDIKIPGYLEADTVAHCGNSLSGEFANSLTFTDLASGWTENRAIWTKLAKQIVKRLEDVEKRLPFSMIGFASDNGSEFINEEVEDYLKQRSAPVNMVRRRPYKKNDNAHVEQKNWTHVRQLFGYERVENEELVPLMNEIYQAYWNPILNFFTPVLKLVSKERIGGRVKKKYDDPKSPYKRLLDSSYIDEETKTELRNKFYTKNPIFLKKQLDQKLHEFFKRLDELKIGKRMTGSP